ncbi:hypothetical protein OG782_20870 [Streptomyces sp. NBC_00876]|uniref:hypothetical protein n=1 Tax=Streptomyces sp. NBC_00876 TaxID=2975853 RepID=UPI00386FD4C1|nr:hypothetical protein OG782_20870 [Streptomyces sp. NBC_00876]
MRIRAILSLAASAVAVVALATPSQAADDGVYLIHSTRSGACLNAGGGPFGGRLGDCGGIDAAWRLVNLPDGAVQFRPVRQADQCLGLSPVRIFPPAVSETPCDSNPDQWLVEGPDDRGPIALRLKEVPQAGSLTARGDRATLAGEGAPEWALEWVG